MLHSSLKGARLIGNFATDFDDSLHPGTKEYAQLSEPTENFFNCKPREWDSTPFIGLQIQNSENLLSCTNDDMLKEAKINYQIFYI